MNQMPSGKYFIKHWKQIVHKNQPDDSSGQAWNEVENENM